MDQNLCFILHPHELMDLLIVILIITLGSLIFDKISKIRYPIGMAEEVTVTTERVDDIPLLIEWMEQMGLITLTNEYFPPHGNWQGLDPGRVLVGWLAHILSQADHRLNQAQD